MIRHRSFVQFSVSPESQDISRTRRHSRSPTLQFQLRAPGTKSSQSLVACLPRRTTHHRRALQHYSTFKSTNKSQLLRKLASETLTRPSHFSHVTSDLSTPFSTSTVAFRGRQHKNEQNPSLVNNPDSWFIDSKTKKKEKSTTELTRSKS